MSPSEHFARILSVFLVASTLGLVSTAHATALEPLAATMAINRDNDFATPPWKILNGVPGMK